MTEEEVRYLVRLCFAHHPEIQDWLSIGSFDTIAAAIRSRMKQRKVLQLNKRKIQFLREIWEVDNCEFLGNYKDAEENPHLIEATKRFVKESGLDRSKIIAEIGTGDQIDDCNNCVKKFGMPRVRYD